MEEWWPQEGGWSTVTWGLQVFNSTQPPGPGSSGPQPARIPPGPARASLSLRLRAPAGAPEERLGSRAQCAGHCKSMHHDVCTGLGRCSQWRRSSWSGCGARDSNAGRPRKLRPGPGVGPGARAVRGFKFPRAATAARPQPERLTRCGRAALALTGGAGACRAAPRRAPPPSADERRFGPACRLADARASHPSLAADSEPRPDRDWYAGTRLARVRDAGLPVRARQRVRAG